MLRTASLLLAALVALAGCGGDDTSPIDSGVPSDTGGGGDADAMPDSSVPTDSSVPSDSGTPDAGDASMMSDVRFIVMGDVGEGNTDQREVAVVIRDLCAAERCDFVVLLGDNIYDAGVDSVDDPQWAMKFEDPYRDIDLPFYAVLGNHDYGGRLPIVGTETGGLGNEFEKGAIAVAYTARSDKWEMPDTFYTFQFENVGFVGLDTNSILWDDTSNGDQRAWWPMAMAELATADWIITLGHHPYLSNGAHGNAGTYESIEVGGIDIPIPVPILDGANVKDFFDDHVCGVADVSLSGHDHNRQWLDEPAACGGTELIVSGAGAKVKGFDDRSRNGAHFQEDTLEGFMYVIIEGDSFIGRWVNRNGENEYERMITRRL